MKYRLLDLLSTGPSDERFEVKNADVVDQPFDAKIDSVRCQRYCAFKKCAIADGGVSPADCQKCYGKEIRSGEIVSSTGKTFPIVGGIPRFLPDDLTENFKSTQKTFSLEWKMHRPGDRNWGQTMDWRKEHFLKCLGATPADLKGKLIFDAGCGSGALAIEMAKTFGMEVIALDLAFGIERAYEFNTSPFVHFVQGTVLAPPLRDQIFDYVYSAGVLVALPDTREGFHSIIRTLKPGGRCFIWVYHPIDTKYHPRDHRKLAIYNWIRVNIMSKLPIRLQRSIFLALIPPFMIRQWLERTLGIQNPDRASDFNWREKMQGFTDLFSPIYQNRHTYEEVLEWFEERKFSNVTISEKGPHGFGAYGDRTSG